MEGVELKTNLIVNYLPQTLTDEEFRSMFLSIGPIKMSKIVRDKNTGYSFGFGFINYENELDADRAITTLNGLQMQHKRIKVAHSRKGESSDDSVKGANVYVRGLPIFWTETELNTHFKLYGTIVQSRVLVDLHNGQSKRVGFVLYSKRTEAEQAIELLNGKAPSGSPDNLYLKFADDSSKKVRAPANSSPHYSPPPHFQQPMAIKPRFSSPGPMRNQRNRQHYNPMVQNGSGNSYGSNYGNYGDHSYDPQSQGQQYEHPQHPQYQQQYETQPTEEQPGHVLFVYNLGTEADERVLWEMFGPCGTVSKVSVTRDKEQGLCKGFGFVTMPNFEEAEYAVQARNGTFYNGKQLQVSFKK